MKRHGGGGRGGAKARGVLRADKEGANATKPAGGNGTKPAGGNGTKPAGGNGTKPAVGNGTKPAGGNGSQPLLLNGTLPGGNNTNETRPELGGTYGGGQDPKKVVMSHFPAVGKDRNCECLFETDEAPNTAIILYRSSGNLLCFGSIVDQCHILTSKKCLAKVEAKDLRVVVGCLKAWWGPHAQVMKVKKIIRHEFGAALLWLKTKITFTKFVQPARLPSSSLKSKGISGLYKGSYYIAGFFLDPENEPGGRVAKDNYYLLKGDTFYDLSKCKKFYTISAAEEKFVFCTRGNCTYCWGGWGSPVLSWQGSYMIQIGFVLNDCCAKDETGPFLAARTDFFGDWINALVYDFHKPS